MKNIENKKIVSYSKEETQAIRMIKDAIDNGHKAFLKYLAGGIVILLNNDLKREFLRDIVKKEVSEDEWKAEKRQHNRRISSCYTLATRRSGWFSESMSPEEVFKKLDSEKINASAILKIEESYKPPKDNTGKPESNTGKPESKEPEEPESKEPEEPEEPDAESAENNKADKITLALGIRWLKGLTSKEVGKLERAMLESGYTFTFHKTTEEEKKKIVNLYK